MYEYRVIIDRWVDGIQLMWTLTYRFWCVVERSTSQVVCNINAPESRTRDLEEKKLGLAAKDFCKNFAKEGEPAILKTKKYDAKGKFGRILGEIWTWVSSLINL